MSKSRILIVEDEVIIAIQLEENLKSLGYEVTSTVNHGDDAIKKAEEDKPDLVIMDIRIQGNKDGIDAAEVIRKRFGIPVVFSTAYLDEERIERAKITMPFGYILKPIQERDLKVTLEMALYVSKVEIDRRAAEAELRRSESRWRSLSENSPNHIIELDTDYNITNINRTVSNLDINQVIGTSFLGHFEEKFKKTAEDCFSRVLKTGKPDYFENSYVADDGIMRFYESRVRVIKDSGQTSGLIVTSIDMTEHKLIENELMASKKQLEEERNMLQEVMNGAKNIHLVYLDRDFNFIRVNKAYAESCGYEPEDMIGKNHFELYPHEENKAIFANVRDTGIPFETKDKPFVFPDQPEKGVTYWDWSLVPVKDSNGIVKEMVLALVETTEKIRKTDRQEL